MPAIEAVSLEEVRRAAERTRDFILRTPLIPLHFESPPAPIRLKLENLQPIGSFKLRGAGNAIAAREHLLGGGVYTASAGNMAQGVAWNARRLEVPCTVIVPDHAPRTKIEAVKRLGGRIVQVDFGSWWEVMVRHEFPGIRGLFVHPVSDPLVIAGNGTIGLEILEDYPEVETILVPFGGGGLSCGIACAAKALKPGVRVLACEVETAAPLTAALRAGKPVPVEYQPSFVDGVGAKCVLEEMWPLARQVLDGTVVVTLEEVESALRMLAERHRVISEGAGALPVAAALSGRAGTAPMACVVSGGNIDLDRLCRVLGG